MSFETGKLWCLLSWFVLISFRLLFARLAILNALAMQLEPSLSTEKSSFPIHSSPPHSPPLPDRPHLPEMEHALKSLGATHVVTEEFARTPDMRKLSMSSHSTLLSGSASHVYCAYHALCM